MHATTNDQFDLGTEIGCGPAKTHQNDDLHPGSLTPDRDLFRARRSCSMVWGWIALALLTASVATAQTSHEFRFGVLNTFLRSPGMYCLQSPENFPDCIVQYHWVPEGNAKKIAAELLVHDLDVIVLNEVFDEAARDRLIRELSPTYPHYVSKIDDEEFILTIDLEELEIDSFKVNGEDSGLMVFSRFAFEPLPDPVFKWDPTRLDGTTDEVAYIAYQDFEGHDMLAAKGVGLVRVKDSVNNQIYAIVFSHMQADSDDEQFPGIRERQFDDVERLITDTLGLPTMDHIFLAGDLNVRGEGAVIDGTTTTGGNGEWQQRFGNGFFNEILIDAWAATTSKEDTGVTNYGELDTEADDKRLDYIAPSVAQLSEGWCVQHLRRRELGPSDHLLVKADYNLENPLCDPRRAWHNPPLDQFVNYLNWPSDVSQIANPAGVQWFFYDLTGGGSTDENLTVSIGVPPQDQFDANAGTGVVYELYDPSDLSTPIPQYRKEETNLTEVLDDTVNNLTGIVHLVPERFFVKVYSPEPSWTGNYSFLVHEHTCTSPEDRCILSPNESPRRLAEFDPNVFVGQDDTMWFQIDVAETPTSGLTQLVRAFAGPYTNDNFKVTLVDPEDTDEALVHPPLTKNLATFKEFEGEIFGVQSMFLRVQREDATLGDDLEVGWDTNLTILHGRGGFSGGECAGAGFWRAELLCKDETNPELGSDEIHLLASVDNGLWQEIAYFDFECNDGDVSKELEAQLNSFRFVDNIRFKLVEEDGPINPDDAGPEAVIQTLAPHETVRARQHIFWEFADGRYEMKFNMSRCAL